MRKQVLSALLALCIVLGMLSETAQAAWTDTGRSTTSPRSEVVVEIPDRMPQIRYYNDLGQIVCCINFDMSSSAPYNENIDIVTFEYAADGRLKSSDCSQPMFKYGSVLPTEFYPKYGHLDYTYTSSGIEAYDTDGKLWCTRNQNGWLTSFLYFYPHTYSYAYNADGTLSGITYTYTNDTYTYCAAYDVSCNGNGQIIRCERQDDNDEPPAVFAYNSNGQMSTATCTIYDYAYSLSFSYDANGEVSAIRWGGTKSRCWHGPLRSRAVPSSCPCPPAPR